MTPARHRTATRAVRGLALAGVTVAAVTVSAPADARLFARERFHDSSVSDPYDCDGTPAIDSVNVRGQGRAVLRGSSPYPFFLEHVSGTSTTTNTATGGTFTNVFSTTSRDHKIVDNGDGTITITTISAGS